MAYTQIKLSHTAFIFDRIVKAYIILSSGTRKAISATESTKAPNPLGQFYQLWSIWLAVKGTQWHNNRKIYFILLENLLSHKGRSLEVVS